MTREEIEKNRQYQLVGAAFDYCRKEHPHYDGELLGEITDAFEAGAEWDYKEFMCRACEYLESVLEHDLGYYGAREFADRFRKAMEG